MIPLKRLIKMIGLPKRPVHILMMLFFLSCSIIPFVPQTNAQATDYYRIVLLADLHLPYKTLKIKDQNLVERILAAKSKVIDDLNLWDDVNEVVLLGDIMGEFGSDAEYKYAQSFLLGIKKPVSYLVGNHDYLYQDPDSVKKLERGTPATQKRKLEKFKATFGLNEVYYSKKVGLYFLVYLSPDKVGSKYSTEISAKQLKWFKYQLAEHNNSPTIVFFHAPLKNTLENYNRQVNMPQFIVQPEPEIEEILQKNQQVFIWVSGHTHTGITNPSFNSKINYYEGRVLNVHNSDLERETIFTNSLYLYPDKVVIKTFNHKSTKWIDSLERVLPLSSH